MEPQTSAVVTGAARGVGRSIAELLVRRSHHVVITDLNQDEVRRTADQIGAVAGLVQDVSDESSHSLVAAEALRHGRLAGWVNNAGVGHDGNLADLSSPQVRNLVEVNLCGTIWGCGPRSPRSLARAGTSSTSRHCRDAGRCRG